MKDRFWSEHEIETVRRMKMEGHKLSWIAEQLGRSYDGVRGVSRRFISNRPNTEPRSRPWTDREIGYVEAAVERGDTLGEVAGHLRRSQSSVKKFAWRRRLVLRVDAERDRTMPRPRDWGLIRDHAAQAEAIWKRCHFEDDPKACRREPPLCVLEIGVAPVGIRRADTEMRSTPTLPSLPSEAG